MPEIENNMLDIYRKDHLYETAFIYSKTDVETTYNLYMWFWYQKLRQLFQPTED